MKEITVRSFKFKSYVYLSFVMGVSLGLAIGFTFLLLSFFTDNVLFTWNDNQMNGFPAGVAGLFFAPFFMGAVGVVFGIAGFLPFKLFMKIQKKLSLQVDCDNFER